RSCLAPFPLRIAQRFKRWAIVTKVNSADNLRWINLLRPDRKLAATWCFEVKAPAAGEVENFARNFSAEPGDFGADLFKIRVIKNNQRSAGRHTARAFRGEETTCHAAIIKGAIVRAVILKGPSKKLREEILGGREIPGR